MRILHVITHLDGGGAQTMLYKLLSQLDRVTFEPEVISLIGVGHNGRKIQSLGIPVSSLGMHHTLSDFRSLSHLVLRLRQNPPDIIQTWMYHSDLVGGLAARLAGAKRIIWNIRHTDLQAQHNKRTTLWVLRACAYLSTYLPERIIACSESAKQLHIELGYAGEKMMIIPNGFDLNSFKPDSIAYTVIRQELGLPYSALLIGMVARFDPQKDHQNFIQAAQLLLGNTSQCTQASSLPYFVLCGEEINKDNTQLVKWIDESGLADRFLLLGRRNDIARLTAALDIASLSSSFGEGFPNVVGEAMACGVPCVVTDVGDSARIVGDTGKVVPPKDSHALAIGWQELLNLGSEGRVQLGLAARQRVYQNFNLPSIVAQYETLYRQTFTGVT